jgi:DNA-binding MarR family transcriptional regulator
VTSIPGAASGARQAFTAYLDAVAIIEPVQARLWNEARLTLTQTRLLRLLREGPQGQSELGRSLHLSPASVTRLIDRLEERGLVARHRDPEDRRRVTVHLEPSGRRLVGEANVLRGTPLDHAISGMTDDERERLTAMLRDLVRRANEFSAEQEAAPPAPAGTAPS